MKNSQLSKINKEVEILPVDLSVAVHYTFTY